MLKEDYDEIQKKIYMLIPEKWEKIYLYAGITSKINNTATWELFFYYLPKGVLKRKLVNVYEVPSKFNLDEAEYLEAVKELCNIIKKQRENLELNRNWNSLTICISEKEFKVDYNYLSNIFSSNIDQHIMWKYKYLEIPIEQFNKKERKVIQEYLKNDNSNSIKTYIGKTLEQGLYNQIEYSINENSQSVYEESNDLNSLPINHNIDKKVELKNQMLNFD